MAEGGLRAPAGRRPQNLTRTGLFHPGDACARGQSAASASAFTASRSGLVSEPKAVTQHNPATAMTMARVSGLPLRPRVKRRGGEGGAAHLDEAAETRSGAGDPRVDPETAGSGAGGDQPAAAAHENHRPDHDIGAGEVQQRQQHHDKAGRDQHDRADRDQPVDPEPAGQAIGQKAADHEAHRRQCCVKAVLFGADAETADQHRRGAGGEDVKPGMSAGGG